jgi:hypothetical protein
MREAPAYSSDRFPADCAVALLCSAGGFLISGPIIWYFALAYLHRTYPDHPELDGAAAFTGLLDGVLIGLGVFVLTFAIRIWLYERRERKQSDDLLKRTLDEIASKSDGR